MHIFGSSANVRTHLCRRSGIKHIFCRECGTSSKAYLLLQHATSGSSSSHDIGYNRWKPSVSTDSFCAIGAGLMPLNNDILPYGEEERDSKLDKLDTTPYARSLDVARTVVDPPMVIATKLDAYLQRAYEWGTAKTLEHHLPAYNAASLFRSNGRSCSNGEPSILYVWGTRFYSNGEPSILYAWGTSLLFEETDLSWKYSSYCRHVICVHINVATFPFCRNIRSVIAAYQYADVPLGTRLATHEKRRRSKMISLADIVETNPNYNKHCSYTSPQAIIGSNGLTTTAVESLVCDDMQQPRTEVARTYKQYFNGSIESPPTTSVRYIAIVDSAYTDIVHLVNAESSCQGSQMLKAYLCGSLLYTARIVSERISSKTTSRCVTGVRDRGQISPGHNKSAATDLLRKKYPDWEKDTQYLGETHSILFEYNYGRVDRMKWLQVCRGKITTFSCTQQSIPIIGE